MIITKKQLEEAVRKVNGSDNFTLVQETGAEWLNSTAHGNLDNDATCTTDGDTEDDIHVSGATWVVCWWNESCVAVYYTSAAELWFVYCAIHAGQYPLPAVAL